MRIAPATGPGVWESSLYALMVVAVAALIGLGAHAAAAWALRRIALRANSPHAAAALVDARPPARLVFALAAAEMALLGLDEPARGLDVARHAVTLALIASAAWLIIRLTRGADRTVAAYFTDNDADPLRARRVRTRVRVIRRVVAVAVWIVAAASMLMTFPRAWQLGVSLLASAGIVGLAAGLAAKPVLANLIAGVQIALTQAIRLEDAVVIDGQFGWVEEITATYVVLRTREHRRVIVPVTFFVERSYENWTRTGTGVIGIASVLVDRSADAGRLREALREILERSGKWDGRIGELEVAAVTPAGQELRAVMSAADPAAAWALQAVVREGLLRASRDVRG